VAPIPTVVPAATPDPSATLVPLITVRVDYRPFLQVPGDTIRFVVKLTNASGRSISLAPCPTYRMYVPGSTFPEPEWLLQGDSLSFEMVYAIPIDVGPGEQLLVWELTGGLRGNASLSLSMDVPAVPTPT
jgi:hypothetical protein